MNKLLSIILTVGISVFAVYFVVLAFTEPTVAPPGGNVPAPINVGSTAQTKAGNLSVGGDLKALSNLCIGEDCRNAWPGAGGLQIVSAGGSNCGGGGACATAMCPAGYKVVGGGIERTKPNNSGCDSASLQRTITTRPLSDGSGWTVVGACEGVRAYAVCLQQ